MQQYFNTAVDWEALCALHSGLTKDVPRFNAKQCRAKLLKTEGFDAKRILPFAMRPFDLQWCYYSPIRPLWREPRPEYWNNYAPGTPVLVTRFKGSRKQEGPPLVFSRNLCDYHMMPPNASVFPMAFVKRSAPSRAELFEDAASLPVPANLSSPVRAYLASLGLPHPDSDQETAELIWYHALAIGYSPAYLAENADGIRQDWPRIPLPNSKDLLVATAALGRQVAALLDTQTPVSGVTAGKIREELKNVAVFQRVDGKPAKPEAGDLNLTAGWGHAGKGGVTMPGKGKLVRRDDGTYDVFLNDVARWRSVPEAVWDYTIGGYQVIKKWLSYREKGLLRRGLTPDEVRYVTEVARRLGALVALQSQLDTNYQQTKAAAYAWPLQSD
jgi:hypothetical protein